MFNSSRISCSFNAVSVDFDGDKKPFQRNLKAGTVQKTIMRSTFSKLWSQ
jgi:hypothetical protein